MPQEQSGPFGVRVSTMTEKEYAAYLVRMRTLMDTLLVSATSTDGAFERRINQLVDLVDPPGAAYTTDADLDLQKWGYWTDGNGGGSIIYTNPAGVNHTMRPSAQRILTANPAGIYPQTTPSGEFGRSSAPPFLPGRRAFLYNHPSRPAGSPNNQSGAEPLPAAQSATPPITIASWRTNG